MAVVNESWMESGACRGPASNLFYAPSLGERREVRHEREDKAKSICQTQCPVRQNCLSYAITNRELFGIWGGLNESERKGLIGM